MSHIEGSRVIICPWCCCEQKIKIIFQNGDGFALECEECGDDFFVEAHVELRFYCSRVVDVEFKEIENSRMSKEDDKNE